VNALSDTKGAAVGSATIASGTVSYAIGLSAALPSASLGGTTEIIAFKPNGGHGGTPANAAITVPLTNATVRTALTGVINNVSSWFGATVAGLTYTATALAGADAISIAVAGTPTAISSAAGVQVTIPAGALSDTANVAAGAVVAGTVSYSIFDAFRTNASIKNTFGITTVETDGVRDTFNAVHDYLLGKTAAQLTSEGIIRLGDYIDLEGGITVDGVNVLDAPVTPSTPGFPEFDVPPFEGYDGGLLRLIVVGVNSFNAKASYDGNGNGTDAHLVFQFQNIAFMHKMEATNTNANGYAGSAMKSYITGPFLTGLIGAGVPGDILWAPTRYVANKGFGVNGTHTIQDELWLPTEREMFGDGPWGYLGPLSSAAYETAQNQAWLEYYTSDALRLKSRASNSGTAWYWVASPCYRYSSDFCIVSPVGNSLFSNADSNYGGCAPAFCVN
jgi:hypothetical protein